jgi:glycosyltransferase involved in cell wall biosynthesis
VEALRAGLPANTPILLVVGRFSFEKGHADFFTALDILRRQISGKTSVPFHALLAGDGPERQNLEAQAAKLGIESFITIAGLQHDIRPCYSVASMVVMPSHSEGSPNVLLEAMAAGVPVVATRVGGVPEIAVDEQTALLTEPRNPEALAAGIARLLEDPALGERLAASARDLAERDYSPEAYRRALVGIYQKLLDGRQ